MNITEKTNRGTFFNKIGVADMERIHSAVIGWMLSDECMAFDIAVRSDILNKLFGRGTDGVYTKIESHLEWEDIDILFLTEDRQGNKDCWVVENKIKSSQHSNQLDKYEDNINDDEKVQKKKKSFNGMFADCQKHFAFLTLIGEQAMSTSGKWLNVTYQKLVKLLTDNINELQDNADAVILREYYHTIQQLVDAAEEFTKNPHNYQNVFEDGWKAKEDKREMDCEDETSRFIRKNNLETIFQKMYFTEVLKEILSKCSVPYERWHVGETRGNADFAIHFYNYQDAAASGDFHFDMSFQAGTFKFAISRAYFDKEGKSEEYIKSVRAWEKDFKELQKAFPEYTRLNIGKSRARISISKNLKKDCKEWYLMDRKTFVEMSMKEFETTDKMRQYVIDIHENGSRPQINNT